MKNGIAMISNFSMPVKSFNATDWIGTLVMKNRYVRTVRPSEIEIGMPVSMRPISSAKMIHALPSSMPVSFSATGIAMIAIGRSAGQRGASPGTVGAAALMNAPHSLRSSFDDRQRMQRVGHRRRLDAFDVRDIVMRQFAGAGKRPCDLQETETHQIGAERNAQIDNPLGHFEIGRCRIGVRDVPYERSAQRSDDAGEQRARKQAEQHIPFARVGWQTVDHDVDAHVNTG